MNVFCVLQIGFPSILSKLGKKLVKHLSISILFFYVTTFQGHILYFLLHYICLTAVVTFIKILH